MTLFMVELGVVDEQAASAWYAGVLGLRPQLRDEENGFVLLEAPGGGRLALKRRVRGSPGPDRVRLVFRVDDLDAERERLLGLGVSVGDPVENVEERYREVRLADPEGTPITLFCWSGR